jgi:hypothetical protein
MLADPRAADDRLAGSTVTQRTAVADAAAELTGAITHAATLIAQPDATATSTTGSAATSRPPWNQSAANAFFDATEGVRRLEPSLRLAVTGHAGARRGGSDANTAAAIAAVVALSEAVSDDSAGLVARLLGRWVTGVQRLRAVDEAETWRPLRTTPGALPPVCPWCGTYSLRAAQRSGNVACFLPGCADSDGNRPQGRLDVSRLTGDVILAWADGTVQS